MNAGAPFARLGSIPAREDPQLTAALALLDQRTHDKFAALDAVNGDVVGIWTRDVFNGFGGGGSKLGNGRYNVTHRLVAGVNAEYRIFLEVGSTTVVSPLGFVVQPPPLWEFDVTPLPVPTRQTYALVPATYAGWIGSVFKGGVVAGLIVQGPFGVIIGQALTALVAGDQVTIEVEFPIRRARR